MDRTILVVDDDSGIRLMMKRLLELKGYRVLTADDGATCVKAAREGLPSLILLDISMPHVGGMSALEQMRRDNNLRHIPVIIVTGDVASERAQQAARLGADDFLQKPFQPEMLLNRIQKHLLRLEFAGLKALLLDLGARDTGLSALATAASGLDWHVHTALLRGVEVRVLVPPGFEARDARALDEKTALARIRVIANMSFSWKQLWPPTSDEATASHSPKAASG